VLLEFRKLIMGISIISYGKNSLDLRPLELRPALGNELSSYVKGPLYFSNTFICTVCC
jgi:hypothetical protein